MYVDTYSLWTVLYITTVYQGCLISVNNKYIVINKLVYILKYSLMLGFQ